MNAAPEHDPATLKACCATAYESPWTRVLLGDSLHSGGVDLTLRLGTLLDLDSSNTVLDVATGRGASAIALAGAHGCRVIGIDLSAANVAAAREAARVAGVEQLVSFAVGDAEQLPVGDEVVEAVICECALCTFPDKPAAAAEFARVLRPGGRIGLTDITVGGPLPPELDSLIGWVACISDARPAQEYAQCLEDARFTVDLIEAHDRALQELVRSARLKLLGAEVASKLGKLALPLDEIQQAKRLSKLAVETIESGTLGYALLTGHRPG